MFSGDMYRLILIGLLTTVTIIRASTTPRPTTSPPTTTASPGSCLHDGKMYSDGEKFDRDTKYNCYWATCEGGSVTYYDHWCFLNPPKCYGEEKAVPGQCCKQCITTTPRPTTTPHPTTTPTTTPGFPGSCLYNGEIYPNGATMYEEPCSGMYCSNGDSIVWDHKCMFMTPECNGKQTYVADQCCPVCDNVTTTTPMTPPTTTPRITTTPHLTTKGSCVYRGKVYQNGDEISRDRCSGVICQDGDVINWDDACMFSTPHCAGRQKTVPSQCCPICINVTTPTAPIVTTITNGSTSLYVTYVCFGYLFLFIVLS